jgi:acyl-CoA dehydrogenase
LAREAAICGTPHRLLLARMVLTHRLLPRDPLCGDEEAEFDRVIAS